MLKIFTPYFILLALLLLFSTSCNKVNNVPAEIIVSEEISEEELFTDDDIDNAVLELASNTISVTGTEGEEIPDGEEVELTLHEAESTGISTQYLPGATGKGCFIVFNPNANRPWQIWLVDLELKNLLRIYAGKAELDSVACNTDGSVIVFSRRETTDPNSDFELYKYNGEKVIRLTKNNFDDIYLSINDDSTIIVWQRNQTIYYREYSGPDTFEQFFLNHKRSQMEPSLGCGGLCIVFVRINGKYSVQKYSLNTREYTVIYRNRKRLREPSTDLRGNKVAFVVGDGRVKIKEGSLLIRITGNKVIKRSPSLSDDGKWLLVVRSGELWLIDLEKGIKKRITDTDLSSQVVGGLSTQAEPSGTIRKGQFAKTPTARLKVEKYFVDKDGNNIGTKHTIIEADKAEEAEEAALVIKVTNVGNAPAHNVFVRDILDKFDSNYKVSVLPKGTKSINGDDGFETLLPAGLISTLGSGESHEWDFKVSAHIKGQYCDLAIVGFAHSMGESSVNQSGKILNRAFSDNEVGEVCLNVIHIPSPEEVLRILGLSPNVSKIEQFDGECTGQNDFDDRKCELSNNLSGQAISPKTVFGLSSNTGSITRINYDDPNNPIVEDTFTPSPVGCTSGARSIIFRHIVPLPPDPAYDAIIVSSFDGRKLCIIPANFQGLVTIRSLPGAPAGMTPIPGSDTQYAYVDFENSKLIVFKGTGFSELHIPLSGDENSCPFNVIATETTAYVVGQEGPDTCNNHRGLFKVDIVNGAGAVLKELNFGTQPRGVALSPNGDTAYVADFAENVIYVIDTTNMTVFKTIAVGSGPVGVTVSSDGKYLLTTNWNDHKIQAIDLATDTVIGTADTGENPAYVKFVGPSTVAVSSFTGGSLGFFTFTPPTP